MKQPDNAKKKVRKEKTKLLKELDNMNIHIKLFAEHNIAMFFKKPKLEAGTSRCLVVIDDDKEMGEGGDRNAAGSVETYPIDFSKNNYDIVWLCEMVHFIRHIFYI